MKKQVAVVLSFSALLTLSAFAPKLLWQEHKNVNRFPASKEDPKIEEKKQDVDVIKKEIKIKSEEATVQCLKDEQSTALEEEIKKLVADKEAIIKQIDDLKAKKEKSPALDKKVAQATDKEDVVALISQMTSMMISQQEQQQMLMQQMFTMMNQLQTQMTMQSYPQQQQAFNQPQNFMAPMTFPYSQMGYPSSNQESSIFGNLGSGIGIGYPSQSMSSYQNPYEIQARTPSAQMDPQFSQRNMNVQPQFQSEYPVGNMGFNFLSSDSSSEMQRMMF